MNGMYFYIMYFKLFFIFYNFRPDKASTKSIEQWTKRWKPKWQYCTKLPKKCWVTSVAKLNEKIYISSSVSIDKNNPGPNPDPTPFEYDSKENKWCRLSPLPSKICNFSLVAVQQKNCILAIGGHTTHEVSRKVFTLNGIRWSKDITFLTCLQHVVVLRQLPMILL